MIVLSATNTLKNPYAISGLTSLIIKRLVFSNINKNTIIPHVNMKILKINFLFIYSPHSKGAAING